MGADRERLQFQLASQRSRRPLCLLLVVYGPGKRLKDPMACTVLGVAEDRMMAFAADRHFFTGVERLPGTIVAVRWIGTVVGIIDRDSFACWA